MNALEWVEKDIRIVTTPDDIAQVAAISAIDDRANGNLISEPMKKGIKKKTRICCFSSSVSFHNRLIKRLLNVTSRPYFLFVKAMRDYE
ncbi:hypothetical protein KIN20_013606 [Parelaphostrongylus tenuis]|uniref:Uncharacterized protein n=1 Tax=Parelaphostrongylus tenuis TaxID=148309 RepID=A0AAD5MDU2_PARTN|nr:hypothetical protein KIN20_013606 [Parelaphostrongylus tenuis]